MKKPRVLIPVGYGLNCEEETDFAFRSAGAEVEQVFIKDLEAAPKKILDYDIVAMIGGFAYADHIAAGTILKNKLKYSMGAELSEFVKTGKLIIGICNGFQVLVKLGLVPGFDEIYDEQVVTLTANDSGKFYDNRWVTLKTEEVSPCIWTKGIDTLYLPVRHGEGKFVAEESVFDRLERENHVVFRYVNPETKEATQEYPYNPNGSPRAIAAISNKEGNAFGLMPHPEAALDPHLNPEFSRMKARGEKPDAPCKKIFENAVSYVREKLI